MTTTSRAIYPRHRTVTGAVLKRKNGEQKRGKSINRTVTGAVLKLIQPTIDMAEKFIEQ